MIEVWAPRAQRVRVRTGTAAAAGGGAVEATSTPGSRAGTEVELARAGDGWWRADLTLADGERYGFVVDEGELRPDPRSRRQPDGVHAASAAVDTARFAWTDDAWTGRQLADGLIYELHLGTFTPEGTLDAAIDKLPHLVELGVSHIELLPVNGFNGTWNWGYDGVLWYTVHEAYGGPAAYARFVDAAHAAGLAVLQDVVYNHLGPSGNYLPEFGPYLREGSRNTWGDSVNLDEPAVRAYIVENALQWLRDFHVDGLRLDAVHALHDEQPVHILQEMAEAVDALSAHVGRPLTLIAESDMNDPTLILPREAAGYGLTAQWSDDWHHAVHVALTGETVGYYADFAASDALSKVWTRGFFHDGTYSSFRGRTHGHPVPTQTPTWRLVTFAQDHDQIGNRAAGDRLSQTLSADRLAVAAVLTLTAPGTPMLFMGEEWAASTPWQFFTSHPEDWLGDAVRTGRTAEFAEMGWDESLVPDPQDPATFERSRLDWSEVARGDHARILALYRDLARLRAERPELTDPASAHLSAEDLDPDAAPDARRFLLGRGAVRIAVNLTAEPWDVAVDAGEALLLSTVATAVEGGAVRVAAESAVVLGPPLG
ncbi:malto-oligosyltrehalose trehalohydrolase [Microbacterium sp. NPDC089189]|uniref:malto-oligosyltrehalose trehalohydrolase n=1 Tax=Microbacterium sp. NPDC089189 TaxID=3154972 RepID=UPI003444E6F9